jgi:hypothetical protein
MSCADKNLPASRNALTPRVEAPVLRAVIALMLERFGHAIISNPEASELVSTKNGQKFITACAKPSELTPTGIRDLARQHDAGDRRQCTARIFHHRAQLHGRGREIRGERTARPLRRRPAYQILNQSRKGVLLPQTYKAMCRQCGKIVFRCL